MRGAGQSVYRGWIHRRNFDLERSLPTVLSQLGPRVTSNPRATPFSSLVVRRIQGDAPRRVQSA
jgi:hypothetical protein